MERPSQAALAERFHALHHEAGVLALLNAWDAGSARVFQQAGCTAIGTTSAGIAYALGRADGERLTREQLAEATGRIAAAVELPLTADVETGYGATAAEVADTVALVIAAGAVGINLEDAAAQGGAALRPTAEQAQRLQAARGAGDDAGVRLFVNARTDVFWLGIGERAERLELTIERAREYVAAGADGIFVPGLADPDELARLVRAVGVPVNVLATPDTPSLDELQQLGVRRLSIGSGAARAALDLAGRIALEVLETGTSELMVAGTLTYREANELFR
ncbi:isocitrate lyase/phosphoenolpyruvate mutase family protein [Conexibacter sp. CPCC 206217]|uniref:isocitrate lyase/PEP mutase family protein n=1 Tax=Conexibacter sp. CPCC 206217 TaxID=3064574 RepID=UPI002726EC6B|nr:isocitrate lyase/phosphoenolpyruvate mutase family protein [Conexibacter sp. CPCC 206217]MDO8213886.1 isocitrate lyase/phosphoenolpyruvate mutase family protein [Conexibacter sp. CPCC 206217]